eukprot:TCONS_00059905-protein
MPKFKLKHIVSFSSEDLKNPAENLLKPETYFKWRSATSGERQVSAIIQLEKANKIHSVDVGNNGSAFVEVLVGRSSWAASEEFKVLQPASSFMSPADSKANKDLYRVRMFGNEGFTKSVSEEKWDQVKFVCTQPYNQNEAYGLSFVTIHSPPEPVEKPKEKTIQLGRFKLRSTSDDEEDTISTGSFFRDKKLPKQNIETPKRSMAATCRDARTSMMNNTDSSTVKTKGESTPIAKTISISNDSRNKVAANLLSPAPTTSINSTIKTKSTPKANSTPTTNSTPKTKTPNKQEKTKRKIETDQPSSSMINRPPPSKKIKVEPKKVKKIKTKKRNVPKNKILDKVVFVLSGFVNPQRGEIRDLAMEMGARFSQQWDNNTCTHLICAFPNTPKFREVKGKGKIVRETWIKSCYRAKRRLNTQSFRLDGGGESSFESTDSEDDTPPVQKNLIKNEDSLMKESADQHIKKEDSPPPLPSVDDQKESPSSEYDTEDELEKLRNEQEQPQITEKALEKEKQANTDVYDCTTDEDDDGDDVSKNANADVSKKENVDVNKNEKMDARSSTEAEEVKNKKLKNLNRDQDLNLSQELPDFLEEKGFLLYGKLSDKERRLCKRYITAYGGTLHEYMGDGVTYVLSKNDWGSDFDDALNENKDLVFLRPTWLFKCHEEQKLVDTEAHIIPKN